MADTRVHDGGGAPKRILVTGGAGFIGSNLCLRLIERAARVICLDDFSTGRRSNLDPLLGHPNFDLLEHDIANPIDVDLDLDEIYNLACPASPVQYQSDPVKTTRTNVDGAINVLELARSHGAKILQASTSEVYGDPEVHPQPESYMGRVNPIGPRACYDEGKRCAETLFFDYFRQHGLRIKVARIFNTYGPRMRGDDGRVVSTFIVQALTHQPLTVFGDGRQTRSFCYVDDLVEGLIRLMEGPDELTGPINLGRPEESTMLELAEKVLIATGSTSPIVHVPIQADDPVRRCPDITFARHALDWEPKIDLATGLRAVTCYFEDLHKQQVLAGTRGSSSQPE